MKTNYTSPLGNILIEFNLQKVTSVTLSPKTKKDDKNTNFVSELKEKFDQYFTGEVDALGKYPLKYLDLSGTNFQNQVWKELRTIKAHQTSTYSKICEKINRPKAYRAVGSAVGKNPFFILLPCHRVLGKNKTLNGFAYGLKVKKKLLNHENLEFIS